MKKKQTQSLFGVPKVGTTIGSTTYVMLIGQLLKCLKMWPKTMFTLVVSSEQHGKITSK